MAVENGTAQKTALVVVDMQEDFCEPDGALAVKDGRSIAQTINTLLEYPGFAMKIGTADVHPIDHISFASKHTDAQPFTTSHTIKNPENQEETQTTHCVQNTKGAEFIPEVNTSKFTHLVTKGLDKRVESYSAFGPPFRKPAVSMSNLNQLLSDNGITDVVCVGLAFDFCVKHTAIDAVEHGYRTSVIEEATKAVIHLKEALEVTRAELQKTGVKLIGLDSVEFLRRAVNHYRAKSIHEAAFDVRVDGAGDDEVDRKGDRHEVVIVVVDGKINECTGHTDAKEVEHEVSIMLENECKLEHVCLSQGGFEVRGGVRRWMLLFCAPKSETCVLKEEIWKLRTEG